MWGVPRVAVSLRPRRAGGGGYRPTPAGSFEGRRGRPARRRRRPSRSACTCPRPRAPSTSSASRAELALRLSSRSKTSAPSRKSTAFDLRDAVHVHLERARDVRRQAHARSLARWLGHLHRMHRPCAGRLSSSRRLLAIALGGLAAAQWRATAASRLSRPSRRTRKGSRRATGSSRSSRSRSSCSSRACWSRSSIRYRRSAARVRGRRADPRRDPARADVDDRPGGRPLRHRGVRVHRAPRDPGRPRPRAGEERARGRGDGHQFSWEYRYPNGVVAIDRLRAPAGRRSSSRSPRRTGT